MLALSVLMLAAATPAASTGDPCAGFDAEASRPTPAARAVTASDLVTIADIGRANAHDSESPFGVSPDGRWIAFVVRRANPLANQYCQRLLVAPVLGPGPPREVDRGGEFSRCRLDAMPWRSNPTGSAPQASDKGVPPHKRKRSLAARGPLSPGTAAGPASASGVPPQGARAGRGAAANRSGCRSLAHAQC